MAKKRETLADPIGTGIIYAVVFFICLLCGAYLISTLKVGEEYGRVTVLCAAFLSAFIARIFCGGGKWEYTALLVIVPWSILLLFGLVLFREIDLRFMLYLLIAFALGCAGGTGAKRAGRRKNARRKRRRS